MKLIEIIDLHPRQKNLKRIKQNANQQINHAKVALDRLKILRDQQKLNQSKQSISTTE